ncbi:MAG: gamma-glutamyl-gamma-aminobutyrate hydrolase family protein [Deltaproteobacteria bacterium]|nr:gamma-glutamyl-gamma-aminobutyrate hydrolase family protein [Deltaproteobacteria bacterium]MBW2393906.1 gamma-glutamyl-gamma-aminobutyrate hydrolase family protein [Deltaproteobacteria bacterium]
MAGAAGDGPARPASGSPWIGVTTYHRERDGRSRFTLPDAYVEGIRRAGGEPVLLVPGAPAPASLLDRLDGLVMTGGGDLHPDTLGTTAHGHMYSMCEERDRFELALVRSALARSLPTLAICRGLQVLNVALGGDIHSHLPDEVGEEVAHRKSQTEPTDHPVQLEAGTALATLFGCEALPGVASWHHQAVRRLGEGLRPAAYATDGTVEALVLDGAAWLQAVQWHPELELESVQARLFRALVEQA